MTRYAQLCTIANEKQIHLAIDNFKRGLHSHAEAGDKTGLAVCLTKIKGQN
jgi:hypothetical protein